MPETPSGSDPDRSAEPDNPEPEQAPAGSSLSHSGGETGGELPLILAAIMENTRAQLAYLDDQFNFVLANAAYIEASGHSREELAGSNHFDLFPDPANQAIFEQVRASGQPVAYYAKPFKYAHQPWRGTTFWDWTLSPVKGPDGRVQGLVISLVDVTNTVRLLQEQAEARRELERLRVEAEQRTAELSGLLEISRDVASSLEFEEILTHILHHLRPLVQPRGAAIFVEQGAEVVVLLAHGDDEQTFQWFNVHRSDAPLYNLVFEQATSLNVDDLQSDHPLAFLFRTRSGGAIRASLQGSRSWLGIPLMVKGRVIGMFRVDHAEPNYFTPRLVRLAQSVADHAAVAIENARLYREAQRAAAYDERQRLARELHDSISQSLYGIALGTHSARRLLKDNPVRVASALDYVLSLSESAVAEMRALIFELRPESLEREGLAGALVHQVAAANARYRYQVEKDLEDEGELPAETQYALYRIAQEAMNNAGRHGRPQQVTVHLKSLPDRVLLEVSDDGAGFDTTRDYPGHLGLKSMRERAAAVGATFTVESAPGCGTTVRVEAPRVLPG